MAFEYNLQKMVEMVATESTSVENIAERLKSTNYEKFQNLDWNIATKICEGISSSKWEQLTVKQRTSLLFEVFEVWPTYTTACYLHHLLRYDDGLDANAETYFWSKVLDLLVRVDTPQCRAIEYVLWVDFFEDQNTCERTWIGLMKPTTNEAVRNRLLVNAGPVPYALKKLVYDEMVQNPDNHALLAESLARSLSDYCGKIDREDAKSFLATLELPQTNKFVVYLTENL